MKKRAVITGISGYIGSNLARRLVHTGEWLVAGIIPHAADLALIADIKDQLDLFVCRDDVFALGDFLKAFDGATGSTTVFHLAAYFVAEHVPEQVATLVNANILFGTQVLEAMCLAGIHKIVNTGTSWQHYENQEYNPVCLYAATKEAFEKIIRFYIEARKFEVITLALFDTYGSDDPRNKIMNLFAKIAKSGECFSISPGEQELDFVYIDDVIDAYLCADVLLGLGGYGDNTYSVATGNALRLKDIALLYEQVFGVKLNIDWGKKSYRAREVMKVWSKGNTLPGWQPRYLLAEGLHLLKKKVQRV